MERACRWELMTETKQKLERRKQNAEQDGFEEMSDDEVDAEQDGAEGIGPEQDGAEESEVDAEQDGGAEEIEVGSSARLRTTEEWSLAGFLVSGQSCFSWT